LSNPLLPPLPIQQCGGREWMSADPVTMTLGTGACSTRPRP
jgi:hypothetical protein